MQRIKNFVNKATRVFSYFVCAIAVAFAIVGVVTFFTEGWFGLLFLPIAGFIFMAGCALKKSSPSKIAPTPKVHGNLVVEEYYAAGVDYYLDNIGKLATRNELWSKRNKTLVSMGKADTRIFRYTYINKPVKLIPEPTNEHDRNAVIVQIAGEKVGYIPAEDARHVKEILNNCNIKYISAFISGGQYKIPREDGEMFKGEDINKVKIKIAYTAQ